MAAVMAGIYLAKPLGQGWVYFGLVQTAAIMAVFLVGVVLFRRYERRDFERWLATQTT